MSSVLGPTFGTWLVSAFLETALYGMGLLQIWLYFHWYPKDHWCLKATVLFVATLETLQMALFLRGTYTHFVSDFGNSLDLWVIYWEDCVQTLLGYLSSFIVQMYFAYCVYILSKNRMVFFVIVVLATVQIGAGLGEVILSFRVGTFSEVGRSVKIPAIIQVSASLACDIMITAALCISLGRKKTFVKSTRSMLHTMMVYAINRGVLTVVFVALSLILYLIYPDSFYSLIGIFICSKLYTNNMLATLNSRDYVRNQGYPPTKGWRSIHLGTPLGEPNASSRTSIASAREPTATINLAPADYEMIVMNKSVTLADMI